MKNAVILAVVATLSTPNYGWSEQKAPVSNENSVGTKKAENKRSRKKRAAMCPECGKPESACECGHADTKKTLNAAPSQSPVAGPNE